MALHCAEKSIQVELELALLTLQSVMITTWPSLR